MARSGPKARRTALAREEDESSGYQSPDYKTQEMNTFSVFLDWSILTFVHMLVKNANKSYKQLGALNIHMHVHRGTTPYTCDRCGKAFVDPSSRTRHETEFHQEPFVCDQACCGKRTKRERDFRLHMREEHNIVLPEKGCESYRRDPNAPVQIINRKRANTTRRRRRNTDTGGSRSQPIKVEDNDSPIPPNALPTNPGVTRPVSGSSIPIPDAPYSFIDLQQPMSSYPITLSSSPESPLTTPVDFGSPADIAQMAINFQPNAFHRDEVYNMPLNPHTTTMDPRAFLVPEAYTPSPSPEYFPPMAADLSSIFCPDLYGASAMRTTELGAFAHGGPKLAHGAGDVLPSNVRTCSEVLRFPVLLHPSLAPPHDLTLTHFVRTHYIPHAS
ncbi:hypothetical protein DL96DRAFT_1813347 [Flagelloscypha sp. PMI_526]|nr:hypothetical protein DL96DRAFT_1813347 [Flagelloscypha sp. PMI_526]